MWVPGFLASLGDAYGSVGRTAEGLRVLGEGLELAERTGECCWEAELHRLKGELLLIVGDAEAGACFRRALEVASRQGSKGWELRAATSLGRLWRSQGRTDEARELVAGAYAWFMEGFDTADVRDAKALLDLRA